MGHHKLNHVCGIGLGSEQREGGIGSQGGHRMNDEPEANTRNNDDP
jgi:hypothetical protein